jgi:hypothetical protein
VANTKYKHSKYQYTSPECFQNDHISSKDAVRLYNTEKHTRTRSSTFIGRCSSGIESPDVDTTRWNTASLRQGVYYVPKSKVSREVDWTRRPCNMATPFPCLIPVRFLCVGFLQEHHGAAGSTHTGYVRRLEKWLSTFPLARVDGSAARSVHWSRGWSLWKHSGLVYWYLVC